jgi:aerobic-type carbon monoxide dehydrogenase small subunit (CoxS/CutS family)
MSDDHGGDSRLSVSRRSFLKGVSGAAGAAALVGGGARHAVAQEAAAPEGTTLYPAGGAEISLRINGEEIKKTVEPSTTLLELLREQADLTGSKEICSRGACGGCTVLVNGKSINSCMTLAVDVQGDEIVTVEGLAKGGSLDPVQQAFADHDACQCGYCIPGFVVRSRALLDETPNPSLAEIKEGLSGNICRCGTYIKIFEAVGAAAKGGLA